MIAGVALGLVLGRQRRQVFGKVEQQLEAFARFEIGEFGHDLIKPARGGLRLAVVGWLPRHCDANL
jgi:hypothetical protein